MIKKIPTLIASGLTGLALMFSLGAQASYPDKPIRMIVTFVPGVALMCWRASWQKRWLMF